MDYLDADAEGISDLLFVIEPESDKLADRQIMQTRVASDHVGKLIIKAAGGGNDTRQIKCYMRICRHPSLKAVVG